jgi:hypothetical protein
VRTTWFSARAFKLHAAAIFVVAACAVLGWWQFTRAIGGNTLSWVYTFEWPFFALYAIYMWWKFLHEPLSETRAVEVAATREREQQQRQQAASVERTIAEKVDEIGFDPYDEADPELAAYNRYLASLHRSDTTASQRVAARPTGRRQGRR